MVLLARFRCCPSAVVVLALLSGAACISPGELNEPFVGWTGETYKPKGPEAKSQKPRWIQQVSWTPRAFVYHNFMTEEECTHIKKVAAPTMKRSTVVGANGSSVEDEYRTSYGTFVMRRSDPIVTAIEQRVAEWVGIPEQHAEDMQVLRYGIGQQYKPHMDTLRDEVAGPRVATVLLYFADVEEGGETAFPNSKEWLHPELPKHLGPFSNCTNGGVAFKPRKGDALLFFSIKPDGKSEDYASMHTGCPVLKGVKWTGTKWIHAAPFRTENFGKPHHPEPDPGHCVDSETRCKEWADIGECERNRGFMVGDVAAHGKCRKACGVCKPCKKGDIQCYNANREKQGYLVYDAKDIGVDLPLQDLFWPDDAQNRFA